MRILILGAGATGGYYGARLVQAGADVTFLVRPTRAERLATHGLRVKSPRGDATLDVKAVTEGTDGFDAVILSCKAYDLDSAIAAIAPAVRAGALVLPLLNGVRHMEALDARFGRERILGGLCHVGVTLDKDGTIRHLNQTEHLALGPRTDSQNLPCQSLHATLARAGLKPTLRPDIERAMWEKFVLLAVGAGMTCLMRAAVGAIVATEDGEALTLELLEESAAVAAAEGQPIDAEAIGKIRQAMTERGSPATTSMLRDLSNGGRTEGEHVLGDMVGRAKARGVRATLLRACRAHLQAYEAGRQTGAGA